MRKSPLLTLFSFALLLAACGGGGSGDGGVAPPPPPPTPLATATPTPSPTPTAGGSGQALSGPQTAPNGAWGPPGVAINLDFPVQHAMDGTGQTVAIVIDSDVSRTDLTNFFTYFKIPTTGRTITTRSVDGAVGIHTLSLGEAELDTETIAGLAPGANVIIYQIPGLDDQSITDAYTAVVADKKAYVVNSSFGGCEGGVVAQEDPAIASGAAAGITFTASSGDSGNECDTTAPGTVGASWPASNPHVVGVGGTSSDPSQGGDITSHSVWNDKTCGSQCGGGGGVSGVYHTPTYQSASLLAGCLAPATGAPCSATWRNVPDISFPGENVAVYLSGKWQAFNGTSWSSPIAASLYAELYQYCGANGGAIPGVGEPASFAYYVYGQKATDFIDVITGNNQMGTSTPFYAAMAGFDDAGGLGVPMGWSFAQTACPGRVPPGALISQRTGMSFARTSEFPQHTGAFTMDVTPRVNDISDMGARGANEPTRIQLVIQPENAANNEAAAVTALQGAGFNIVQRFSNHLTVDAVAPSSTVEQFFRTRMHNVSQGQYGIRYLPTTQIMVPASIAPYVVRVSLDNVITRHLRLHVH